METDIKNKLMDTRGGEEGGWDEWREEYGNIYTKIGKIKSQWELAV